MAAWRRRSTVPRPGREGGSRGATLFCGRGGVMGRANLVNWTSICHSLTILLPSAHATTGTHGTHAFPRLSRRTSATSTHHPDAPRMVHKTASLFEPACPLARLPACPLACPHHPAALPFPTSAFSPSQQSARTLSPSAVSRQRACTAHVLRFFPAAPPRTNQDPATARHSRSRQ